MKRAIAASLAALFIGAGPLAAGGCASMPEPCTSEWVRWKTDRFVADFVNDHREEFGEARNASGLLAGADLSQSGNIPMFILGAAGLVTLASDFMNDLWPEVGDALSECDTAPRAAQLFASILRDQGVDERAAQAVEKLGLLLDRRS